jgi:hypothetical protein
MPAERATRRCRRTLGAAAALVLATCLLPSCGGDSSNADLSQERASNLRSTLDEIENRIATSDCTGAAQQASAFRQEVADLPARVDSDLRDALAGSANRLESLVADQCQAKTTAPAQETTTEPAPADENPGDQGNSDEQGKKPKKPKKPKKEEPPPDTGVTGQEGSTGVTGPDGGGGAAIPPGE